jgi:MFS family permease
MTIGEIASVIGPVRGVLGMAGVLLGGVLADRLGRRSPRWRMLVPGIFCLLVVPAEAMFLLADPAPLWIAGLGLTSLFTIAHQGPIFAAILSVARVRMRATAVAFALLCTGLLGQVLGPLTVGILNDRLAPILGPHAIRYSMTIIILTALLGGLCFLLGAASFEADVRRAGEEDAPPTPKELP